MSEHGLAVLRPREIVERNTFVERLAYSPDEAAELLGICRELVHDLLRTGQLGSDRPRCAPIDGFPGPRDAVDTLRLDLALSGGGPV